jgi:purine-binding chemotaxis protein CheW
MSIAVPVAAVQEIVRAVAVSPLPDVPPFVEGVINARGTLVPVFDLRRRFGLPPRAPTLHHHFVLAFAGSRLAALRVDRALDLIDVAASDLSGPEEVGAGGQHVASIARLPDGLLVIQDLESFLSTSEGDRLDAALAEAAG